MEFEKSGNRFYKNDEKGKMLAEVTYVPSGEDKVILDHTFVDPSLRGQGIAAQLVDRVVEEMRNENKKIVPLCPYAKTLFERKPEKYADIEAK
ncbi:MULTISPECIES: GNAT family N-acetyltransferase [Carnobacterium]|uniref:GNAT family N-acetyltransferase n=1 Tax=Carnobacterium antarcticum TaxID=2126436 RepID=A0ABW4NQJ4_9LACT|nr:MULTISPECIES: GNAT family N-acetyltransferase [unclassified Carnobacterium]ALV22609.1 Acetyltransferase [Carnobacterium sp. CP1]QQP70517.1 N-acetyltransferase [Carnobacterium sp. CS13]